MTENELKGIRILGAATRGRFHACILAGPANAETRAVIMGALEGRKVPRAQAGTTAIETRIFALAKTPVGCRAAQMEHAAEFCRAAVGGDA